MFNCIVLPFFRLNNFIRYWSKSNKMWKRSKNSYTHKTHCCICYRDKDTVFEFELKHYQLKIALERVNKIYDCRHYPPHINMQTHNSRKSVCAVPLNDNHPPPPQLNHNPQSALTPHPLCGGALERSAASVEAYHRLSRLCTWADPLTPIPFTTSRHNPADHCCSVLAPAYRACWTAAISPLLLATKLKCELQSRGLVSGECRGIGPTGYRPVEFRAEF